MRFIYKLSMFCYETTFLWYVSPRSAIKRNRLKFANTLVWANKKLRQCLLGFRQSFAKLLNKKRSVSVAIIKLRYLHFKLQKSCFVELVMFTLFQKTKLFVFLQTNLWNLIVN